MENNAEVRAAPLVVVKDWITVVRLPFHTVGIFPIVLGTVLAVRAGVQLRVDVLAAGLVVVISVMLATYLLGEHFDFEVDRLSAQLERNRFSGGTQALQAGRIDRRHPIYVSLAALLVGGVAGGYAVAATRELWLLPLGLFGVAAGVFYSVPPFRWVQRGIGEVLIGVCYGWLPVAVGFLLQTGEFSWRVSLISVPVALTIFNVILINEIPDEPADSQMGKRNLVVRFGREAASYLYAVVAALTAASLLLLVYFFSPRGLANWMVAGLLSALAVCLATAMAAGVWRTRDALEKLCGLSIVLNLSATVALMFICTA